MGLLSRHGSSASSRRAPRAQQENAPKHTHHQPTTHGHQPALENTRSDRQWVGWRFVRSGTTTPRSMEPSGIADDVTYQNSSPAAPTIPARTSSKDAPGADNLARSLARKGLSLKTSASKLSLVSNLSSNSMWSANSKKPEKSPRSPVGQDSSPISHSTSSSISGPTRFQHLTHAVPEQFSRMAAASQSDLVADFSALRASQNARRDFRGIKTIDLHSRNSSAETNTSSVASTEHSSSQSSATTSLASESSRNSSSSVDKISSVSQSEGRAKRSPESFSQPFSNGNSPRFSAIPRFAPPPRTSSRKATTGSEERLRHENSNQNSQNAPQARLQGDAVVERPNSIAGYPGESPPAYSCLTQDGEYGQTDHWTYGEPLPRVTEESGPRSRSPPAYPLDQQQPQRHQVQGLRPASPAARSSSRDSNITITPTDCNRQSDDKPKTKLPETQSVETVTPKEDKKQRRSIQRSSLNNGLFTSWSFDDEASTPPKKDAERQIINRPSSRPRTSGKESTVPVKEFSVKRQQLISKTLPQLPTPPRSDEKITGIQLPKSRLPTKSGGPNTNRYHHRRQSSSGDGQPYEAHRHRA